MSAWTAGYVTDLGYTYGFYRELTPHILGFSAMTRGIVAPSAGDQPLTCCELGCGQGLSVNILAAANPHIDFYATDFNPAQIAGAQRLAEAGGVKNLRLFDDSFAQFYTRTDLPQFDIISLHGIYSWIAKEHRDTIVRFIDKRLKPGGLVYISYNCLPGWAASSPMRHLMYLHGRQTGGPTGNRLDPALSFLEKMFAANARTFATLDMKERFERLKPQNRNYLAHEYFNDAWDLFYHSDVAQDLAAARLSYIGSAHLMDHVDVVNLTADQQMILNETPDPVLRETLRDYMINQQFRRDIFARGTVALATGEAKEAWFDSRFALSIPRSEVTLKVQGALGDADLQQDVYAPFLDAFAKPVEAGKSAAISLRQIVAENPAVAALGWARIQQALLILVGAGYLQPCPADAKGEQKRRESTTRFNQAVFNRARYSADLQFLASPVTGGGVVANRFEQLFLLALVLKEKEPVHFVWRVLQSEGQRIMKDGTALETDEENLAELAIRHAAFEKRLPVLKSLGIV